MVIFVLYGTVHVFVLCETGHCCSVLLEHGCPCVRQAQLSLCETGHGCPCVVRDRTQLPLCCVKQGTAAPVLC